MTGPGSARVPAAILLRPRPARRWIGRLAGWLLFLGLLGGAYAALHLWVLAAKPVPVRVHRVGRGVVEQVVSNTRAGSVRSRMQSRLSADAAARVVKIVHREGAKVEKDEILIVLDDRTPRANLLVLQQEQENAQALESQAKVSLADCKRELERQKSLFKDRTISQAEIDRTTAKHDMAQAALLSATAKVKQAEASQAQAHIELGKLALKAPFAGVIAELLVEEGEWALPGKPLVRLVDLERLYVRAELDEVDTGRIKVGLPVRMKLDPFKGQTFSGTVIRVAPYVSEVQEQNRTVEIEVSFKGGLPPGLKPGTSADVEVVLESTPVPVLRIPTLALMEGDRVLLADGERARKVKVVTGLRNWDFTEVKSGLAERAPVIVSLDREEVKDGVRIKIEKEADR